MRFQQVERPRKGDLIAQADKRRQMCGDERQEGKVCRGLLVMYCFTARQLGTAKADEGGLTGSRAVLVERSSLSADLC